MSEQLEQYKEYIKERLQLISESLPSLMAGDFSKSVDISLGDDEFTELYGIINELREHWLKNVKKHMDVEEELEKYRQHLEELVEERKDDLKGVNEQLKEEIAERFNFENAVRESEGKFRTIFEGATDGILGADIKTKEIFFTNPRICEITGYSSKDLLGFDITMIHPKKDLPYLHDWDTKQVMGKATLAEDIPILRRDNKVIYCDINSKVMKIGNQEFFVGFFKDITERKRAEEELKRSEERLRILFECAPDAIYLNDLDGNFVDGNKAAEELVGYSKEELIGKNFMEFNLLPPDYLEKAVNGLAKNIAGEPSDLEQFVLNRKDGKQISVEIRAFPVNINGQDLVLGIARDITERKQIEEKLIQSEKLAGIGILASGIAHELNNPLSGVLGYAEVMLDEQDPKLMKKYARKIIKNTERATDIVRWISRYSMGAKDSDVMDVDLNEVINESLEALKHTKHSFKIEVLEDYQKIPTIKGNRYELQQIFVNLMNNAMDAMHDGGRLGIFTGTDNGFVEVRVSDTGIGIPKDVMNRIFEPFYTTKVAGLGTGLGLYVTSIIIKKHQGEISVKSEVGKGTTFTLKFQVKGGKSDDILPVSPMGA